MISESVRQIRDFSVASQWFYSPGFEHQAKVIELRLDPLKLLLIGSAVKQADRRFFFSPGNLRQRRLLLILKFIGYL
ncbi:Uncharacterised protein [Klebsiella michiganensis]|uniref:Uncharacterized protein n=1 Tax=Klebsiella michiganensis TaxID=1134687 RepID=A0A7H4LUX3_9ENTR|nr:Uncharacterised protein [Klebsiella michiganensis]